MRALAGGRDKLMSLRREAFRRQVFGISENTMKIIHRERE